jgi:hypothetical protein
MAGGWQLDVEVKPETDLKRVLHDIESTAASHASAEHNRAGEGRAPAREITTSFGRVYQMRPDQSKVAIEWIPPSPILGCIALTRGQAVLHPTEGKVVHFPQAIRRRRGTTTIVVRTGNRPDLLELFDLAIEMEAKLRSEVSTGQSGMSRQPANITAAALAEDRSLSRRRA